MTNPPAIQPPPQPLRAGLLMAGLFLRLTLGRRRTIWLGLALLVPIGLAVFWRFTGSESGLTFFLQLVVNAVLQFFTLGLCLYLGVAAVRDEIEDRTIVYLFARPVHRAIILGGKILAVFAVVGSAMVIMTAVLYFITLSADGAAGVSEHLGRLASALAAVGLACLVYTLLFSLLGVLFKRPMIPAIVLAFGWEGVVSNLPGAFPQATLMFYIKSMLGLGPEASGLLAVLIPAVEPAHPLSAALGLLVMAAIFLGTALSVGASKQYDV